MPSPCSESDPGGYGIIFTKLQHLLIHGGWTQMLYLPYSFAHLLPYSVYAVAVLEGCQDIHECARESPPKSLANFCAQDVDLVMVRISSSTQNGPVPVFLQKTII